MTATDRAAHAGDLAAFVRERESIRLKKESGAPQPWTADPILTQWRFCNVRREDDTVTRWIDSSIRKPFAGHGNLWFMLAIARWLNWPPSLDALIKSDAWPRTIWRPDSAIATLESIAAAGGKVFTGAYTINAPPTAGATKIPYVCRDILESLWKRRVKFAAYLAAGPRVVRLRGFHRMLMETKGFGPFMAYQVTVDARFTEILNNASDRFTWAAAGPGTLRGLNRVYAHPLNLEHSQEWACAKIVHLWQTIPDRAGVAMDLSDVPNILCEFDKYERVRLGQGTPRAAYVPGRGF